MRQTAWWSGLFGTALGVAVAGCASTAPAPSASASTSVATPAPQASEFSVDGDVARYVSSPWGFRTNTWAIKGPAGIVLIDLQFLPSAAEEVVRNTESTFASKVTHGVVLHANPDKFNGTAVLQQNGAMVLTSDAVAQWIPAVHEKRSGWFGKRYAPDYPTVEPKPSTFGATTTTRDLAGLPMTLHVLGRGASEAHVVVQLDGHLFVGDLIANGTHAWLELGDLDAWLARIDELQALSPSRVYPGRGAAGGVELLDNQRAYLLEVRALIAQERKAGTAREQALHAVEQALIKAHPDYGFTAFLKLGLPAVWDREVGRDG